MYFLSARELEEKLEEKLLGPLVTTVSRGGKYADGETVELAIDGRVVRLQMSWVGRTLRVAWCSYLIIATFFVLYAVVLFSS